MRNVIVDEASADIRLDVFCVGVSEYSRTKASSMIKSGDILVNNKLSKPSYLVEEDDLITIKDLEPEVITIQPIEMDLDILYEDDDLLVINKPQGLIVHPSATSKEPTLVNGLLHYSQLSDIGRYSFRPGIVHRLDKDTSGALVVAKNDQAHMFLANQLQDKSMNRTYWALVSGVFPHQKATVDAPIGRDKNQRQQMTVTHVNAKEALTHFKLLETFKKHSLLEAKLETGRTHQIRVHAQYMKYPVLGDTVYGLRKESEPQGQYLHAKELAFIHPKTKERMSFQAPLPQRFTDKLEELRHG